MRSRLRVIALGALVVALTLAVGGATAAPARRDGKKAPAAKAVGLKASALKAILMKATADQLELERRELKQARRAGRSLVQIAAAEGTSAERLKTVLVRAVAAWLSDRVEKGEFTRERSRELLDAAGSQIESFMKARSAPKQRGGQKSRGETQSRPPTRAADSDKGRASDKRRASDKARAPAKTRAPDKARAPAKAKRAEGRDDALGELLTNAAARFLRMTHAELALRLDSGRTLAEVAASENRSVDGLKTAMRAAVVAKLQERVAAGELSSQKARKQVVRAQRRINRLVAQDRG